MCEYLRNGWMQSRLAGSLIDLLQPRNSQFFLILVKSAKSREILRIVAICQGTERQHKKSSENRGCYRRADGTLDGYHTNIKTAKTRLLERIVKCGMKQIEIQNLLVQYQRHKKEKQVIALPSSDITFTWDGIDASLGGSTCRSRRCLDRLGERHGARGCWSRSA